MEGPDDQEQGNIHPPNLQNEDPGAFSYLYMTGTCFVRLVHLISPTH